MKKLKVKWDINGAYEYVLQSGRYCFSNVKDVDEKGVDVVAGSVFVCRDYIQDEFLAQLTAKKLCPHWFE